MFNQCTLREKCVWWQKQCFDLKLFVTDYFTYYISDCGKDLPEARDCMFPKHIVLGRVPNYPPPVVVGSAHRAQKGCFDVGFTLLLEILPYGLRPMFLVLKN